LSSNNFEPAEIATSASRAFFRKLVSPIVERYKQDDPAKYPWFEKNLANLISLARVFSSFIIVRGLLNSKTDDSRQLYFAAACINVASDGIDGEIARGLGTVSKTGKVIDPIADKVMFTTMAIGLVPFFRRRLDSKSTIFRATIAVAVAMEVRVLITGSRVGVQAQKIGVDPAGANVYGKIKFGLQCAGILSGWGIIKASRARKAATILILMALPFSFLSEKGHRKQLEKLNTQSSNPYN